MTEIKQLTDIVPALDQSARNLVLYSSGLSSTAFFHQPPQRWSPAMQVKHLTTATRTSNLAFTLPRFVVRWVGGRPNRPSRSYDELVAKYLQQLKEGGKASGRYIPGTAHAANGQEKIIHRFSSAMQQMSRALTLHWKDEDLDRYLVAHPLLKKITLRELAFFTIYHTDHHLQSIRSLTGG